MGAFFVSIIGYGLAVVLSVSGIFFFCVIFTSECRGERIATAFGMGVGLLTMALFFAAATAKLTGAI